MPQFGSSKEINLNHFPEINKSEWSIPENIDFEGLPLNLSDKQLLSMTLSMWKEYMLHDEIISAVSFLKNSPCRIRDHYLIRRALIWTEKTYEYMNDKDLKASINTPDDSEGKFLKREVSVPIPHPLSGQVGRRFQWMTHYIPDNSVICDFGCIDGTMSNRWGMMGHQVYGIDISRNSLKVAREVAQNFDIKATYFNSEFVNIDKFLPSCSVDIVTSGDVYEHLVDPVNDLLIPMKKILKGNGSAILTMPNGSWGRGSFDNRYFPWTMYDKGKGWLEPYPRGHILAPSIWSVVDSFEKAGFIVETCNIFFHHEDENVDDQSSVGVVARPCSPFLPSGKNIAINWGDLSQMELAYGLIEMGHKVTYYHAGPEEYVSNFVKVLNSQKFEYVSFDYIVGVPGNCVGGEVLKDVGFLFNT